MGGWIPKEWWRIRIGFYSRSAPATTRPAGGASICALGQAKALSYGLTSVQSKLNMDTPAAGNAHDWQAKEHVWNPQWTLVLSQFN